MMLLPDNQRDNIDDGFCVFVTPRQVAKLNIGLDLRDYQGCEDDVQPFVVDVLVDMARERIFGANPGDEYQFPVENSDACCVTLCLDINGKLCRLQRDEIEGINLMQGLPLSRQVKTFQRLLNERRITLNDLAVADIDLEVYKQLCIMDYDGEDIWQEFLIQVAKWIVAQEHSQRWGRYFKAYEDSPKLTWWEEMAND